MKVLVISFAFPPHNVIGAVRVGRLVAYLAGRGHDVRVVAAGDGPHPNTLELDVGNATVMRTRFFNVEAPIDWMRQRAASSASGSGNGAAADHASLGRALANAYRSLISMPDTQTGWYSHALRAARRLTTDWMPDVIVSSALPFTAHRVAARIARDTGRPWIAEFRDLFADSPYYDLPSWRRRIDRWIEKSTLSGAAACVTISPPLADALARQHGKPAHVVMNGFDEIDIRDAHPPHGRDRELNILYTGIIYPGRRDPRPLFEAMSRLGARQRRVRVAFYGQDLRGVRSAATAAGVEDRVTINDPVPYRDSLRLQREADVLLLLLWNDPREIGVTTGKLFEYIGARRPILAIGCNDGVAASLIRERGNGVTATDPADIAQALDRWIGEIDITGTVAAVPASATHGLGRAEQFAKYEAILQDVVRRRP